MENDTTCTLGEILGLDEHSLAFRILKIQEKSRFVQQKASMRKCVQVVRPEDRDDSDSSTVQKTSPIRLHHHISDEYIAVSCPWHLPGRNEVSGHYTFGADQPVGIIMPPDVVLDRVLNFKDCNPDYLHTPFWLDKLCINQNSGEEKAMAVHSMDLVYQYSGRRVTTCEKERIVGCALGLLFVEITTVSQLKVLRSLLDSKYAENNENENEPRLLISVEETDPVLDMIELILTDNWFHRAWIFQEEFLASRHMVLLLPCTLDRAGLFENEDGIDLFGNTQGEIELRPLNFRTEVTVFCLALSRQNDEARRQRCSKILEHARRYTFLYRSKYTAGLTPAIHAMSPAIFEDISTRGITVPSDILAIGANCCRYISRLNPGPLNDARESLSISILTLFILNGEILRHDIPQQDILGKNVFECLQSLKLKVEPPMPAGELIFIKMCRLPTVTLTSDGIKVRGVLSRLDKKIIVSISDSERDAYWKGRVVSEMMTLNESEKRLLHVLKAHLQKIRQDGGDALHSTLQDFLAQADSRRVPQYWSQQHIQVLMAKALCQAIAERRILWLSRLHIARTWTPWLGIFIPSTPCEMSKAISFAFTATETDHEFKDRGAKLARKNLRVTSLEVRIDPRTRRFVPKSWMNGLCFFNKDHPTDWVIPWPAWAQSRV
jgi:hypothetical protein